MFRNLKPLAGIGLAVIATATFASCTEGSITEYGVQAQEPVTELAKEDEAKKDDKAIEDVKDDGLGRPKRLGKTLGTGIRIKPRPSPGTKPATAQGSNGVGATGPIAMPGAPVTIGGIGFDAGSQLKNFGALVQGDVENHSFFGESNGEDPLIISSIVKSCGCTKAQLMILDAEGGKTLYQIGKEIPVGTKFAIDTTFDTTSKSGPTQSNITLTSNDPRGGVVFTLQANVTPALSMTPTSINFASMKSTDVRKGQTVITSAAYPAFKLALDSNFSMAGMQVELTPDSPDEAGKSKRWVINVEGGPNLPEGNLSRAIRFTSDIPQEGKFLADGSPVFYNSILFVTGQVLGPVSLSPPHVSFGLVRPGQVVTRSSILRVTAEDFAIDTEPKTTFSGFGVDFPYTDDFEVSWTRDEATGDWNLDLTCLGLEQEGNGSFRGNVVIEIGHESKEVIEMGFSGVVRGGVTGTNGK